MRALVRWKEVMISRIGNVGNRRILPSRYRVVSARHRLFEFAGSYGCTQSRRMGPGGAAAFDPVAVLPNRASRRDPKSYD